MSTIESTKKTATFSEQAQDWAGAFEGESRLVVGEMIACYCNQSEIGQSVVDVVQQRAEMVQVLGQADGLALIAEILHIESHFHFPTGMKAGKQAVNDLIKHRHRFCDAVRWLCLPKLVESALSSQELDALAASGKLDFGRYPEIDRDSERFVAYFEDHALKHFQRHLYLRDGRILSTWTPKHLIDLFCVFLLAECAGKTPSQMPMKVCRKCNKLFFTDLEGKARERKQFCSLACQQGGHWTKSNLARSDSGFIDRLLENSSSELRKRLANPTVQERLARIKTQWQDWKTVAEKVKEIEAVGIKERRTS